jgi:hypothetical protein
MALCVRLDDQHAVGMARVHQRATVLAGSRTAARVGHRCRNCGEQVCEHWIGYDAYGSTFLYILTRLPQVLVEIRCTDQGLRAFGRPRRVLAGRSPRAGGVDPGGGRRAPRIYDEAAIRECEARTGIFHARYRGLMARAPFELYCPSCGAKQLVPAPSGHLPQFDGPVVPGPPPKRCQPAV